MLTSEPVDRITVQKERKGRRHSRYDLPAGDAIGCLRLIMTAL